MHQQPERRRPSCAPNNYDRRILFLRSAKEKAFKNETEAIEAHLWFIRNESLAEQKAKKVAQRQRQKNWPTLGQRLFGQRRGKKKSGQR